MNKTRYQSWVERHWSAVLEIVEHIITKFADSTIEIAAKAIALAAPFPNALNLASVVTGDLGWGLPAAFAFALTIEIVVFFLVEVALMLFDGYLERPAQYRVPLAAMVTTLLIGSAVVMVMVYNLETHKIMTLLPLISICAFVGIGLRRWHERNQKVQKDAHEENRLIDQLREKLTAQIEQLTVQISAQDVRNAEQSELLNGLREQNDSYRSEIADLSSRLNEQLVKNAGLSGRLEVVKVEQPSVQKVYKNGDIVHGLEDLDRDSKIVAIAQRMSESTGKVNKSKIAQLVGCARGTVQTVLG